MILQMDLVGQKTVLVAIGMSGTEVGTGTVAMGCVTTPRLLPLRRNVTTVGKNGTASGNRAATIMNEASVLEGATVSLATAKKPSLQWVFLP